MPSLRDKLRWRAQFFFEGLNTHPRALLDPYFWKILLRSSDRTDEEKLNKITEGIFSSLKQKLWKFFVKDDGSFLFPISYYGKKFTLRCTRLPWFFSLIDLWLIHFDKEYGADVFEEIEFIKKKLYSNLSTCKGDSLFQNLYLASKEGRQENSEGPDDTPFVHLEEGDYTIDVGANIGQFTVLAGKVVGEKGSVFAFEPLEEKRKKLEKLVRLNGLHNVTIVPKALGDKNTKISMEGITIKEEGKGEIECITLDSWAEEVKLPRLDFLKMDVEGYERKVLLGGMKTLQRFKPKMGICIYHLPDDPEVLRELILQIDPKYEIQYNEAGKKYIVGKKHTPGL